MGGSWVVSSPRTLLCLLRTTLCRLDGSPCGITDCPSSRTWRDSNSGPSGAQVCYFNDEHLSINHLRGVLIARRSWLRHRHGAQPVAWKRYSTAMNRLPKSWVYGFSMVILVLGTQLRAGASQSMRWANIPRITIVSAAGDSRLEAVQAAISFWNTTFEDLGTPFRLGNVTLVTGAIPDEDLQLLGNQVLNHELWSTTPSSLQRVPGDLLIILSDAQFISFTAYRGDRVIVAIKNSRTPPLTLPNVLQNVIAHELGHAVGLDHNQDPAMLMCGRPAACRPDAFESASPRFFPLSDKERNRLLVLYPRKWMPRVRD